MHFLVESHFNVMPTDEILALIPAETAHGQALDAQGVRERLYIAADNSRAWQVLHAESLDEARRIVAGFPLAPYTETTITPLAEMSGA